MSVNTFTFSGMWGGGVSVVVELLGNNQGLVIQAWRHRAFSMNRDGMDY